MSPVRMKVRRLVEHKAFQGFIVAVILVNAVMIGAQTYPRIEAWPFMRAADALVLAIFTIEIALRIYAHGFRFFRDSWSWFDFLIVAVSYVPTGGGLQVLRLLRVLRVLRLVSVVPSLRRVVSALIAAVPGIAGIGVLLVLIMYVFVVACTMLFGRVSEEFADLGRSMITLFRLLVGDGYGPVVEPLAQELPWAWPFMMIYAVVSTFVVLNLFIAVMTESLQNQQQHTPNPTLVESRILEELAEIRRTLDTQAVPLDSQSDELQQRESHPEESQQRENERHAPHLGDSHEHGPPSVEAPPDESRPR